MGKEEKLRPARRDADSFEVWSEPSALQGKLHNASCHGWSGVGLRQLAASAKLVQVHEHLGLEGRHPGIVRAYSVVVG